MWVEDDPFDPGLMHERGPFDRDDLERYYAGPRPLRTPRLYSERAVLIAVGESIEAGYRPLALEASDPARVRDAERVLDAIHDPKLGLDGSIAVRRVEDLLRRRYGPTIANAILRDLGYE